MRYRMLEDPFSKMQPRLSFADELTSPVHKCAPAGWNEREAEAFEVKICGKNIIKDFPDERGLLETAYLDLERFFEVHKMEDGDFSFRTVKNALMEKESYNITVSGEACVIEAGDTEGIRRAIYFIEDEMKRREGNILPLGTISRKAVIKTRISRSPLVPNYNTGKEGELGADIEGYPDELLECFAHDGVNAIWVQEHFRHILPSEIIPEYGHPKYGKSAGERIKKLNSLIDRAERYGIGVYIEGTEPATSFGNEDLKNHPELWGHKFADYYSFCPSTEAGEAYIKEATRKLYELVPKLKGLMLITMGEAGCVCASLECEPYICPHCTEKEPVRGKAMVLYEKAMLDGMRAVNPDAQFISWSYALRTFPEVQDDYFEARDEEVISMINFEDYAEVEQEGKMKSASDYWLSYTGPGPLFRRSTEVAKRKKTPHFAKIQVCSSHEVSTVPYVPVPGILYDKYKFMHENEVTGVLYCWYFGNYPSVMSKAAGELAFAPFYKTKEEFLVHLAGIYWGRETKDIVKAYMQFEESYHNYPLNSCFEWHSPMGDGPVWPLHLEPVDLPIPKAYEEGDMPGSDRLGEAMLMGHTHEDTLALCQRMSDLWHEGVEAFKKVKPIENGAGEEQKEVARALDILFESGANILRFYLYRRQLAFGLADAKTVLSEMREIVKKEIENSRELEVLAKNDGRLGYHAEAAKYKFFPIKLKWRAEELEKLLETEFPVVEKRIDEGKLPLPFCFGLGEDSHRYDTADEKWENFMYQDGSADEKTKIKVSEEDDKYIIKICQSEGGSIDIKPEFFMFHPYAPVRLSEEKGMDFTSAYGLYHGEVPKEKAKWNVTKEKTEDGLLWTITLLKKDFFNDGDVPFRMAISRNGEKTSFWEKEDRVVRRLCFSKSSPDSYVFIIPKKLKDLR